MASKYWLKLYHEMLDDPKIGKLRIPLKWRFIECLLSAGENGNSGTLPKTDDLAWRLRCDPEKLETDLVELTQAGLLNQVDGRWAVVKFGDRQAREYSEKPDAVRQREYRAKKKVLEEIKNREDIYIEKSRDMSQEMSHGNGKYIPKHSGTTYELPDEESPQADFKEKRRSMVSTLGAVVKDTLAIGMNEADFERVADALITEDISEQQVKEFGKWWELPGNGHYEGRPALKSLLQNIKNIAAPVEERAWYEVAQ